MKRLLFYFTLLFLALFAKAQVEEINYFQGSYLCGDLSSRINLPDSLYGRYTVESEVQRSAENQSLSVTVNLKTNLHSEYATSFTIDLMDAFEEDDFLKEDPNDWTVTETIFIDGEPLKVNGIKYSYGNPFSDCYATDYSREHIDIISRRLEPICPSFETSFSIIKSEVTGDSLLFYPLIYNSPVEIICDAIGYHAVSDTVTLDPTAIETDEGIKNIALGIRKLFAVTSNNIVCVTTPCPGWVRYYEFVEELDMRWEIIEPNPNIPNAIEGSLLCGEELYTSFNVMKEHRTGYRIETAVNSYNDTIEIDYVMIEEAGATLDSIIKTPLNELFTLPQTVVDLSKVIVKNVWVDGELVISYPSFGNPYGDCYEIENNCEDITIKRTYLKHICREPESYIFGELNEEEASISVRKMAFDFEGPICLAEGFQRAIDSVVFKDVAQQNYDVLVVTETHPLLTEIDTIGAINFNSCIISSYEEDINDTSIIYPNPVHSNFVIKGLESNVYLSDYYGRTYKIDYSASIDVAHIPSGIYVATFKANGKTRREKLIIE